MKALRVIVTPDAENDLRTYLSYLRDVKKSPQSLKSVLEDFRETKNVLSTVARSLQEPESEDLKLRGLKRINFRKHNYFMLYHIDSDNVVYITNA